MQAGGPTNKDMHKQLQPASDRMLGSEEEGGLCLGGLNHDLPRAVLI